MSLWATRSVPAKKVSVKTKYPRCFTTEVSENQKFHLDTYIHTYRQTYIHTDRQTEPNYYIDSVKADRNEKLSKAKMSLTLTIP